MEEAELCDAGKQYNSFEELDNALKSLLKKNFTTLYVFTTAKLCQRLMKKHLLQRFLWNQSMKDGGMLAMLWSVYTLEKHNKEARKWDPSSTTLPKDIMQTLLFHMIEWLTSLLFTKVIWSITIAIEKSFWSITHPTATWMRENKVRSIHYLSSSQTTNI